MKRVFRAKVLVSAATINFALQGQGDRYEVLAKQKPRSDSGLCVNPNILSRVRSLDGLLLLAHSVIHMDIDQAQKLALSIACNDGKWDDTPA